MWYTGYDHFCGFVVKGLCMITALLGPQSFTERLNLILVHKGDDVYYRFTWFVSFICCYLEFLASKVSSLLSFPRNSVHMFSFVNVFPFRKQIFSVTYLYWKERNKHVIIYKFVQIFGHFYNTENGITKSCLEYHNSHSTSLWSKIK